MKIHSPVTKISGPPGTGKTTRQLDIVMDLLEKGTPPERIIFTTFTRAGAYEARDRACERFGLPEERFPWFTTLHALCFRRIGRRSVLNRQDMTHIGNRLGLQFTWHNPFSDQPLPMNLKGDHFVQMLSLSRMKMIPLPEVHRDYDGIHVPYGEVKRFAEFYNNYRRVEGKIDFTDMMEIFLEENESVDADYLIVDEAQDLCQLQWEVVKRLGETMKHTFVSGDDDQCVHAWAGADPEALINLEGEHEVLPQSYRIPSTVHELANEIIHRVPNRIEKTYRPREEKGSVTTVPGLGSVPLKDEGSWLLLVRNRTFGEIFANHCYQKGILFSGMGNEVMERARDAIITWNQLSEGMQVQGREVKDLYKLLKNRDRVKHGSKTKLNREIDDHEPIDLKRLRTDFGLLCSGGWEEALFTLPAEIRAFFRSAEKNYDLSEAPKVRISTIHGAKGKEADNVVVIPDMSWRTWKGFHHDRDNEHRVFYVAATRARKNLYLLRPETNKHYEFYI